MRIGALLGDPTAVSRLLLAFSAPWQPDRSNLVLYADWDSLVSEGIARDLDICVVDPKLERSVSKGCGFVPELEYLRQTIGTHSVVLYCGRVVDRTRSLGQPGTLGFPFLIIRDIDDDPRSILRVLARSIIRRRLGGVMDLGEGNPPQAVSFLILDAVTGWPPAERVEELARGIPTSETTLRRNCRNWGIPTPRELLRWSRVLEAVALTCLGVQGRSKIAHLGMRSDSASSSFQEAGAPCGFARSLVIQRILF